MLASVSSISIFPLLERLSSWCTLKFTACFDVWHSTLHTRNQAENFTNTTFAKWEMAMNTLHKMKSVKPPCPTHVSFKSLNPIKTWCSWLNCLTVNMIHSPCSLAQTLFDPLPSAVLHDKDRTTD
jgi:hypothetical protein